MKFQIVRYATFAFKNEPESRVWTTLDFNIDRKYTRILTHTIFKIVSKELLIWGLLFVVLGRALVAVLAVFAFSLIGPVPSRSGVFPDAVWVAVGRASFYQICQFDSRVPEGTQGGPPPPFCDATVRFCRTCCNRISRAKKRKSI